MRELKLFVVVVAVVVVFMGMFLFVGWMKVDPPKDVPVYVEVEDDPDWDCETMGNGVCGL